MSLSGPIQNQATARDVNAIANAAAATAWLPQDVLVSILVRLPASDLRRFRRVCKEWRETISNPAFIGDHMVHGPRIPTHTIVFFPGQPCGIKYSDYGSGFLFDSQWRLTATFSAPTCDEMVGQCNGLLCFLIVDPFSGESLALPVPRRSFRLREHAAYCFGFDPSSRRYKIFHQGHRHDVTKQDLFVYTIGGDEDWRRVQVADETVPGVYHGNPVYANGSVYWFVVTGHVARLERFDLATEEVRWEPIGFLQVEEGTSLAVMAEDVASESITFQQDVVATSLAVTTTDSDARVRIMTMTLPHGWRLARPHALQWDHLLRNDGSHDGGPYTHTVALASKYLGCGELLLETLEEDRPASCSTRGMFVPAQVNQKAAAVVTPSRGNDHARVFCYAPPVSPAPLAHYLGML